MRPADLLAHFDRISRSPDAIPRLRRLIRDLAVRGKLVEQNVSDEPASELIRRIDLERSRLDRRSTAKTRASDGTIAVSECPFELPENWEWIRFGDIAEFSAGRTPPRHDLRFWNTGDYPWISIADMPDGALVVATKESVSEKAKEEIFASEPAAAGTMIMSFKLTIGKIARLGVPAFHNEAIVAIRPYLSAIEPYLFQVLPDCARQGKTKGAIKGATLNRESIANICLPLPPLEEQARIVARVDELMALCDEWDVACAERERRRNALAMASLHRLSRLADYDASAFRELSRFSLRHLSRLTTRPEHVRELRPVILNLAIRGELVEQDPADEPVSECLARTQRDRFGAEREGKTAANLSGQPSDLAQPPFLAPSGWRWVRFGDLITDADAGWSPKSENFPRSGDNWGVLKVSAVSWDRFLPDENKQLLPGVTPPPTAQVRQGDFLISRANTSELVAKSVVVEQEPQRIILSDKIVRLQMAKCADKKFVSIYNNHSTYARAYYAKEASGTSDSMKNVSRAVIYGLAVPLPPLAEQQRIVAKVDGLMSLCERLEAELTAEETKGRSLLEVLIRESLEPVA